MDFTSESTAASTVEEKLRQRMKERSDLLVQRSEQRKYEKSNRNTELENADAFIASFNEMKNKLEQDLDEVDVSADNKIEAMEQFDRILRDHSLIQQYLNESLMFLVSFQVKKYQGILSELQAKIQDKMECVQPKKKFGFRNKATKSVTKKRTVDVTDSSTSQSLVLDKLLNDNFFGFKDRMNERLVMEPEQIYNRQLNLQNLTDCTVQVLGVASTLQAASLTRCTVLMGPTMRSAFVKQCTGCTFVMACQQVRIHDTTSTDFYLHVTGAAIIEGCKEVGFAPYNLEYSSLDEHYVTSGLDRTVNNWDKVEDFRWIDEKEKSPNMFLMEESKRKCDWLI